MKKRKMNNNPASDRSSSFELLRIIAMMGVVILHYNGGDGNGFKYVEDGSINQYFLYLSESIFICAVDLFIMISAFFLSMTEKRKLTKIVELFIQVIVFKEVFYFANVLMGNNILSVKFFLRNLLPANYFVVLYTALYLISPYVNILIKKLSKQNFRKMMVTLILLFSVWTILVDIVENIYGSSINGLSTIGIGGSQSGYSIINFILIYVVGAYIRINEIHIEQKKALTGIALSILTIYMLSILEHIVGLNSTTTWNYNNPVIIFLAAYIILYIWTIEIHSKIINELAKGLLLVFYFTSNFYHILEYKMWLTQI